MKIFKYLLLIIPFLSISQTMNSAVKAKIEVSKIEDIYSIKGTAENLTDAFASISYKLSVIKNQPGSKNQSTNNQSGRAAIKANEIKELSKTQINVAPNDEVILLLLLYTEKGEIIGKDRLVINEKKK